MTILYLHGLESKLNPDKRKVLEQFGRVEAPDMDYRSDQNTIETLYETYNQSDVDVIIGSSMGGFMAFYLALLLQKTALAFNPALQQRSVLQMVPTLTSHHFSKPIHILIGELDTVIPSQSTLEFLKVNFPNDSKITIEMNSILEHQIPLAIFTKSVQKFFSTLIK